MKSDPPPLAPASAPPPEPTDEQIEGVRRQREHIKALDGEDPLRGGVAD